MLFRAIPDLLKRKKVCYQLREFGRGGGRLCWKYSRQTPLGRIRLLAGDMRNRESDWCGSGPKQAVFPNFDAEVKFEERT
ncbi:MAG TPA: hypothetical protein DCS30_18635 [Rhizobiales bacterium]|nr:hypothetical protein [Hyphomicrobiales bacterium]